MSTEQQYKRDPNGMRLDIQGGMNTALSPDLLPPGKYSYLQNVRRYLQGRTIARAPLGSNQIPFALPAGITSMLRLNDLTPAGPPAGYVLVLGAAGIMYVNSTQVKTGLSGNPLSFVTFRPNASPQPWAYVGDPTGMWKVRSDGTTWHVGVAEPQTAPAVTFVGGGTGTTQIFYRYVYRSSVTGATSNPSPESIAGTNEQNGPSATVNASDFATKITFNASQYEFNSGQMRTKGGVPPGTVTDYMIAHNFGLTIPDGVNIDGVQIDLNWQGQNSGTGVLSAASLYYLGGPLGTAKFPGVQNQSFAADTLQGGNSDQWGATLTPAIINDPSFGFGVQITTQSVGGSDRSFVNYFTVTVYYSTQDAAITPQPSSDPQVDKIDFYRQGGLLDDFTYVGTGPNSATAFDDLLADLAAADNPLLEFDNYEPFPSIDMPQAGTVNVTAGAVTGTMDVSWASGDKFNVRWLPGTIIVIAGVAYTFYNRPSSATTLTVILTTPMPSPTTGLGYEIEEPDLAAQPSPAIWGPTPDNGGSFYFGIDPLNTGTLVWSKGNNFDAAPDTNRLQVTSASEILMNGAITSELSTVFSTERFWLIYPNFADALATVTGVAGQQWTLIQSAATRGLYMRYAINALGSTIAWRAKDCVCVSMGGGQEQSITDDIYNLFPHEGFAPQPVTIGGFTVHPPDDTKPNAQTITVAPGYIIYNYQDTTGTPRTLVYDVAGKGWSVDAYSPTVNCHLWPVGQVDQLLAGCTDGTVRALMDGGGEAATAVLITKSENGGDTRAFKSMGDVFVKALVNTGDNITVGLWKTNVTIALTGFSPTALTGSGTLTPYILDFIAGGGLNVDDIAVQFSWALGSGNILEAWQPDWTSLPEDTQDRPTDWTDAGAGGPAFWQGVTLEADTFNQPKAIAVQSGDDLSLHVPDQSPVTFNGQSKQELTFTPPFIAHTVRIVTTDGVPWRLWPTPEGAWFKVPFPASVVEWQTELNSLGGVGWQHLREMNVAHISTADLTLTLTFDIGAVPTSITLTIPNSGGGQAKTKVTIPVNKFKLVAFRLSSTAPFRHFKEDMECKVGNWGRQEPYRNIKPFGGESSTGAEV